MDATSASEPSCTSDFAAAGKPRRWLPWCRFLQSRIPLYKKPKTGGHHTWTREEIATYCERHKPGSKAWLALWLFLLTGQRRCGATIT
jgi:hypothetical protein